MAYHTKKFLFGRAYEKYLGKPPPPLPFQSWHGGDPLLTGLGDGPPLTATEVEAGNDPLPGSVDRHYRLSYKAWKKERAEEKAEEERFKERRRLEAQQDHKCLRCPINPRAPRNRPPPTASGEPWTWPEIVAWARAHYPEDFEDG